MKNPNLLESDKARAMAREWIAEQARHGVDPTAVFDEIVKCGLSMDAAQQLVRESLIEIHPGYMRNPDIAAIHGLLVPEPLLDTEPREIEVDGRKLDVVLNMTLPRIVVFDNFLSDQECEQLIEMARPRLAPSSVIEAGTGNSVQTDYRTSDGMFFEYQENPVVSAIERRIAKLVHWPAENGENIQVLRYGPDQQYKPHNDFFDPADAGTPKSLGLAGQRCATLVMYLNTPKRGGGTTFPDAGNLTVEPKKGRVVFFSYCVPSPDRRTLHAGRPVLEGEKWVATKWLRRQRLQGGHLIARLQGNT